MNRRRTAGLVLAVALLSAGVMETPRAESNEFLLNDDQIGSSEMRAPDISALPDSSFLYVWIDGRRGQRDVFAARIDGTGAALSDPVLLNDDFKLVPQWEPAVGISPDGSLAWAAWVDERAAKNVYAQRLMPDGSPVESNIPLIPIDPGGNPRLPDVAVNSEGTALVVWQDLRGTTEGINGRRVDAEGALLGDTVAVMAPSMDATHPSAAALPNGEWVLVWEDAIAGQAVVWVRRFSAELEPLGFPVRITAAASGSQLQPIVRVYDEETLLVLWTDTHMESSDLYFNFFSTSGVPQGEARPVRDVGEGAQERDADIALRDDGTFLIAWLGFKDGDWIPMVRPYDAGGEPASDVVILDDPGNVVGLGLAAAPHPDGRYICAWVDERTSTGQSFMKMYAPPDGVPELAQPLLHLVPGSSQIFPDVALRPDGSGMAVWVDQRGGNPNIYGRLFNADGFPLDQSFLISAEPLGRFGDPLDITSVAISTPRVETSPSRNYLVTWALGTEAGRGRVMAQVYGPSGQAVGNNFHVEQAQGDAPQATPNALVDEESGLLAVVWEDNTNDTGGDVFMQRYSSDGLTPIGDVINFVDEAARPVGQFFCSADINEFGQIIAAWTDERNGGFDIYAQDWPIQSDSYPIANRMIAGEEDGQNYSQAHPDVSVGGESYIVVWDDAASVPVRVKGLLVIPPSKERGPSAAAAVEELRLNISLSPQANQAHFPRVSMADDGRFVVTWWDNLNNESFILARNYAADGTPTTDPYLVTPLRQEALRFSPSVEAQGDSIRFVFADTRRDLGWDVYMRRADWMFNGDSIPDSITPTPVLIAGAAAQPLEDRVEVHWLAPRDLRPDAFSINRRGPLVNPKDPLSGPQRRAATAEWLNAGAGMMGWTDRDVLPGQSYAYWIYLEDPGGRELQAGPLTAAVPAARIIFRAQPNPFPGRVVLTLPPAQRDRRVEIYDVQGRRVWTRRWPPGAEPLEVAWDATTGRGHRAAEGIYWARITGAGDQPIVRLLNLGRP
ncbi:MAG: hypothetical protein GF355_14060 [Candidatus Eisenbacteria bacterium]|nr:hypothetical protein [Candidatus Eisenbacteria bacterium]